MIDIEEIKEPFRERLVDSAIFASNEIGLSNQVFEPTGLSKWITEYYLPVSEDALTDSDDDLQGIFQYTINTKINTGGTTNSSLKKQFSDLFGTREVIETDNYQVSISSIATTFEGRLEQDSVWYTSVVDITFSVFGK